MPMRRRALEDLPSMPNFHIRVWYILNAAQIREIDFSLQGEMPGEKRSPRDRALRAWSHRKWSRAAARSAMQNDYERFLLEQSDSAIYGNPDGPSFDHVTQKAVDLGRTGDDIWEEVISDAWTTNADHNKSIGEDVVNIIDVMCDMLRSEIIRRGNPSG